VTNVSVRPPPETANTAVSLALFASPAAASSPVATRSSSRREGQRRAAEDREVGGALSGSRSPSDLPAARREPDVEPRLAAFLYVQAGHVRHGRWPRAKDLHSARQTAMLTELDSPVNRR